MSKYVVGDVYFNNDTRVNVFVEVWMVLLDEVSVGSFDVRSGRAVVDAKDFIGVSVGSWFPVCVLFLLFLALFAVVAASLKGCVSVLVALADVLFFELLPFPPHAVFIPGVDTLTLAAPDPPDSEMRFSYHHDG